MHPPASPIVTTPAAAAAESPPGHYVVRPAGVLAELLGAAELGEDESLLRLRELGLITYPSPLLGGLLDLPAVLAAEVLPLLEPTDLVVFGQAARACRAAVVAFGVPQEEVQVSSDEEGSTVDEGTEWGGSLLLRVQNFVGSVARLAWAKARGCPWDEEICAWAARGGHLKVLKWAWGAAVASQVCCCAAAGGHLKVLQWAREHGCEWDALTCAYAAMDGNLRMLRWAHEHGCPWDVDTCFYAAQEGHLHVLQYARAHGCEWNGWTTAHAARWGHFEVLKWAREHHCPWDDRTCSSAIESGNMGILKWAREHGCLWRAATRDAAAAKGYTDSLPLSV